MNRYILHGRKTSRVSSAPTLAIVKVIIDCCTGVIKIFLNRYRCAGQTEDDGTGGANKLSVDHQRVEGRQGSGRTCVISSPRAPCSSEQDWRREVTPMDIFTVLEQNHVLRAKLRRLLMPNARACARATRSPSPPPLVLPNAPRVRACN